MSIESVMLFNHLFLFCLLLLLPSIFPSIRVFSNELALCTMWPKYCSFIFSISPSNEYSGLIPFGMDWLDLLAVQEVLGCKLEKTLAPRVCSNITIEKLCSLGKTLLAFALFHSVLQGQICLLLQVFLDFLLLLSSPLQ